MLARLRHDPVLHATPVILCSADLPARPAHGNAVLAPGCALLPPPVRRCETRVARLLRRPLLVGHKAARRYGPCRRSLP